MKTMLMLLGIMLCCQTPLACSQAEPMGRSVRMAIENQTLDPKPATDAPVEGLDGRYAMEVMKNQGKLERKGSQAKDLSGQDAILDIITTGGAGQ